MKDDEIIAHQARKLIELEVKIAHSVESERQLLEILREAGIDVKQIELNPQEAEFLLLYRQATPEGKARIREKVEAVAAKAGLRAHAEPLTSSGQPKVKEPRKPKIQPGEVGFSDLPKDFFKSSSN